jgi:tetratricopeptide (TPR) repeat protein/membrane protease YdiL (CAAX protease family)
MTTLGLALGFGLVPQIIFAHFREPSHGHLPLPAVLLMLTGLLIWLAEPALLILSVKRLELRPLRALGLAKPTLRDLGLGFVAFVVASGVTHLSTSIISKHAPGISSTIVGPMAALMRMPIWMGVALAVFNGFSEELAARGYAIERFERITGSTFVAAMIALLIDLAAHVPSWGRYYPLLIAPTQLIFILLFLWRRNLQPCIIAHILCDAFPLLVFAMIPGHFLDLQGAAYYQERDYTHAREEFTRALKYDPRDAYALLCRGQVYLGYRDYEQAVADLSGAIKIKPSATAYYNRMHAYLGKRDYPDAEQDLAHAIKLDAPRTNYYRESYYSTRARAESDDDSYDAAIRDWTAALKLNPNNLDYRRGRAIDYMSKEQYDQAIADYGVVIRAKPIDAHSYADRAMVYDFKHDGRHARSDYDQAIRLSPGDADLYIRRSGVESAAGDDAKAVSDLQTAINLKPGRPDGYVCMATQLMYRPHPDFNHAIGALKTANDLSHGTDATTLDMLAFASAEIGDYDDAAQWEQQAISHADAKLSDEVKQGYLERLHAYERAKSRRRPASRRGTSRIAREGTGAADR